MKNWSTDENYLKKFPEKYKIWCLDQKISYGLDKGEKISRSDLIKYWQKLSPGISPARRNFLKLLLWG